MSPHTNHSHRQARTWNLMGGGAPAVSDPVGSVSELTLGTRLELLLPACLRQLPSASTIVSSDAQQYAC
eukprot:2439268-Rhodomonas_salina.1